MKPSAPKHKQMTLFRQPAALALFVVYKNAQSSYEHFINQYCQIPEKLQNHYLINYLIAAANAERKSMKMTLLM